MIVPILVSREGSIVGLRAHDQFLRTDVDGHGSKVIFKASAFLSLRLQGSFATDMGGMVVLRHLFAPDMVC